MTAKVARVLTSDFSVNYISARLEFCFLGENPPVRSTSTFELFADFDVRIEQKQRDRQSLSDDRTPILARYDFIRLVVDACAKPFSRFAD